MLFSPGLSNLWPAMLSHVARVESKVAESYIAELNILFSLICWSSVEPLNVYIYVYISCYDVKDVRYSFSKSIHLHKMY